MLFRFFEAVTASAAITQKFRNFIFVISVIFGSSSGPSAKGYVLLCRPQFGSLVAVRAEEILLYPLSALILIFSAYVFANPVNGVTRLPQYLSVPLSATDIRCVDNPYKSVLGFAVRTGKDFSHALVLRMTVSGALGLSHPWGSRIST